MTYASFLLRYWWQNGSPHIAGLHAHSLILQRERYRRAGPVTGGDYTRVSLIHCDAIPPYGFALIHEIIGPFQQSFEGVILTDAGGANGDGDMQTFAIFFDSRCVNQGA